MTKAKTQAERRRQKRASRTVTAPEPDRSQQRLNTGRGRPSAADIAALNVRCLRFGIVPSEGARQAMRAVWAGDDLGLVLMRTCRSEDRIRELWTVWQGFTSAARVYRSRVLSCGGVANAALPMLPEQMQTDVSHSVDIRSSDERDRDAVLGWLRWTKRLGEMAPFDRMTLIDMERGAGKELWVPCKETVWGVYARTALASLCEVSEK